MKTSSQLDKPRYVIAGFQTDRINKATRDASEFDSCNVKNIEVFINSNRYPYEDLEGNRTMMFKMFIDFQKSYYKKIDSPYTFSDCKNKYPLYAIDCSRQDESVKISVIDLKIKTEIEKELYT